MNINCYNKETENMVRKQFRDNKGRFAKRNIVFYLLAMAGVIVLAYYGFHYKQVEYIEVPVEKIIVSDNISHIIDKNKKEILDELEQCESGGDATVINWNDGGSGKNRASFGAYQFKIGTVQHYNKDLNDFQAIDLASSKERSRELASQIIFSDINGIGNWKNCAYSLGLSDKVKFVIQLVEQTKNAE